MYCLAPTPDAAPAMRRLVWRRLCRQAAGQLAGLADRSMPTMYITWSLAASGRTTDVFASHLNKRQNENFSSLLIDRMRIEELKIEVVFLLLLVPLKWVYEGRALEFLC